GCDQVLPSSLDEAKTIRTRPFQLPLALSHQNNHRSFESGARTSVAGAAGADSSLDFKSVHVAPLSADRACQTVPIAVRMIMNSDPSAHSATPGSINGCFSTTRSFDPF